MVGIAINGVPIFGGNSPNNMDYFYPLQWDGGLTTTIDTKLDACLGAIDKDQMYHYSFLTPCLISTDLVDTSKYCEDIDECKADMASYALTLYDINANTRKLLGMAKDGH